MAKEKLHPRESDALALETALVGLPLWQLDMAELTGHNIEARGREEVNDSCSRAGSCCTSIP
jgi:hypothetical protein